MCSDDAKKEKWYKIAARETRSCCLEIACSGCITLALAVGALAGTIAWIIAK